ncbi:MAG: adenylosuccinate lyase [Chloroflexi bacterium]|nr:adenylosuccinate lyase [Chloroflexota bacterium]
MIPRYSRPEMDRVWSDEAKFDKWLQVEIAVCEAWAQEGVIPLEAAEKIRGARYDLAVFEEAMKETQHDMTAFLRAVYPSLGEESRYLHLGLTTSDIWDTALSLQMAEATDLLIKDVDLLLEALERRAIEHRDTVMIGRTHGVHAEPITFGLKLALWVDEMRRNAERLGRLRTTVAVGKISGAVGTYALVSPRIEELVCERLGLRPARISSQIIQRDIHAEFVMTLALVAASLEKFATEVRGLQRTEILELEEPFGEGQTGSSAMPHKRNPVACERVCGLARLLRGHVIPALENVTLWNERDISHSSVERIIIPDSCLALDYILDLFTSVIKGMTVYPDNMKRNLEMTRGLVFSQRVLTSLIEKGLGRSEAYEMVQKHALKAWHEGSDFRELLRGDPGVTKQIPTDELDALFDIGYYLRHVDEIFQRLRLNGGVSR